MTTDQIIVFSFLLIAGISFLIYKIAGNYDRHLIHVPVRTDEEENVRYIEVK